MFKFILLKRPDDINECNALILPGVGAFSPAMINLKKTNLIPALNTWAFEKNVAETLFKVTGHFRNLINYRNPDFT